MREQLERVKRKVQTLVALARESTQYGTRLPMAHGRGGPGSPLNPPLEEHVVAAFERRHGVRLPEEYRAFVREVGDGGMGPGGLYPLVATEDEIRDIGSVPSVRAPGFLAAPFGGATDEPPPDEWDEEAVEMRHIQGSLGLNDAGCATQELLVLNGPEAGTLWRVDQDRVTPVPDPRRGKDRLRFLDWYEDWLDRVLPYAEEALRSIHEVEDDVAPWRAWHHEGLLSPARVKLAEPLDGSSAAGAWASAVARGLVPRDLFDLETRAVAVRCASAACVAHRPSDGAKVACVHCGGRGWTAGDVPSSLADVHAIVSALPALLRADALVRDVVERLRPWGGRPTRRVVWRAIEGWRRPTDESVRDPIERVSRAIAAAVGAEEVSRRAEAVGRLLLARRLSNGWSPPGEFARHLALHLELRHARPRGLVVAPVPDDPTFNPLVGRPFAELPDPTEPLMELWRTGIRPADLREEPVLTVLVD